MRPTNKVSPRLPVRSVTRGPVRSIRRRSYESRFPMVRPQLAGDLLFSGAFRLRTQVTCIGRALTRVHEQVTCLADAERSWRGQVTCPDWSRSTEKGQVTCFLRTSAPQKSRSPAR